MHKLLDIRADCTHNQPVLIDFDPAKNRRNLAKHGLPFEAIADFDFETAPFVEDDRRDYGETTARHGFGRWAGSRAGCIRSCSCVLKLASERSAFARPMFAR